MENPIFKMMNYQAQNNNQMNPMMQDLKNNKPNMDNNMNQNSNNTLNQMQNQNNFCQNSWMNNMNNNMNQNNYVNNGMNMNYNCMMNNMNMNNMNQMQNQNNFCQNSWMNNNMNNNMNQNNIVNNNMNMNNNCMMNNMNMNMNMYNMDMNMGMFIGMNNNKEFIFQKILQQLSLSNGNCQIMKLRIIFDYLYMKLNSIKSINENNDGEKKNISINFYGIQFKKNIDLRLYISKLIDLVFDDIFGILEEKIKWERTNKSQTTKDVMLNPEITYSKKRENDYSNYLYLEYEGKNLTESEKKVKDAVNIGDKIIINLKFKKEKFENEIKDNLELNLFIEKQCNSFSNKNPMIDNNNNQNQIIEKDKFYMNIIFHNIGHNYIPENVIITISGEESISSLIDEYLRKIGLQNSKAKLKFIFNAKLLEMNQTVGNVFDGQLARVEVIDITGLIGAGQYFGWIDFVDMTSGKVKKLKVSSSGGKEWRVIRRGLNIFGICEYEECKAKGKEVIYTTLKRGEKLPEEGLCFNLNKEVYEENIVCPMCQKPFEPKTCGFWKCEYQFDGKYHEYKKVEGKKEYNSKTIETHQDEFHYYEVTEKGMKKWKELNIYVLKKQIIKYKED